MEATERGRVWLLLRPGSRVGGAVATPAGGGSSAHNRTLPPVA